MLINNVNSSINLHFKQKVITVADYYYVNVISRVRD